TRRGFGASSHPAEGYDSETLANDVLAVMDQMRWERALFVAHSFGGSELNWLAARMPRRVIRMVYLDAAFDFAELYATPQWTGGPFPRPRFPDSDANTPATLAAWLSAFAGPGYPESEVRAMYEVDAAGHVGRPRIASGVEQKLRAGAAPAMLTRFWPPAVALYAEPRNVREKYPWYGQMTPAEQRAAQERFETERRVMRRQQERFRVARASGIAHVPGGRHYLFLSNPGYVEARIRRYFTQPLRGKDSPDGRGGYTHQTMFGGRSR
ncbi:MAG TPA: alpha/beta hydrolase, partial [Longimicrobium sp.]